jgi:peptidoglycan/xylan/chitin deacetylase (PgdA/CDA1 family)
MDSKAKKFILTIGWRFPLIRALSARQPVILLYHSVPAKGDGAFIDANMFEQHVRFLKRHFELVTPSDLRKNRRGLEKIRVLLTFDDGFRNHAKVVAPILRKHSIAATFFVCSRHATSGKYLWFNYLRALERHFPGNGFSFGGELINMAPAQRQLSIRRLAALLLSLTPHPDAMYQAIEEELPRLEDFLNGDEIADYYAGMTAEQVGELAADPLFSIGSHTVDHPFLTKCEPKEVLRQIQDNKTWIEQVCNQRCETIAYPSGDYNAEVLKQCRNLRFAHGYALTPGLNADPQFELPRIGIYSTSVDILGFKVQWGNLMRTLRIQAG